MDPLKAVADSQQWWQYGVLGVGIVVFGVVIVYLFKQYKVQVAKTIKANEANVVERTAWAVEKERLRIEFEQRHNDLLKSYAADIQAEHVECVAREDRMRVAHADELERVSDEQRKASDAMVVMLQKLQDRLVFSKDHGRYGGDR